MTEVKEVTERAQGGGWPTWVRDSAFLVAIAGSAWVIADSIGDLKAEQARTRAEVKHLAVLIQRNAEGIERNAEGIERNAEGIAGNAEAIGEVKESVAKLAGQYEEHTREHQGLASR